MIFRFFKKKQHPLEQETPEKQQPEESPPAESSVVPPTDPPAEPLAEQPEELSAQEPETVSEPEEALESKTIDQTQPEEYLPTEDHPAEVLPAEENRESEKTPLENEEKTSSGLLGRLTSGLRKTRAVLTMDINELFGSSRAIDESVFEELEEILITADFGMDITMDMMEKIRKKSKALSNTKELYQIFREELAALFVFPGQSQNNPSSETNDTDQAKPLVIMFVGVNGTGKTTTLGKLAAQYRLQGKKVLIAAADTFRAAAIEQVETWAQRSQASVVRHREGADPAAVAYDALEASMARGIDVLLVDTAGRLHTQKNLMEELKKIKRTLSRKMPGAPHEVLMVLDATTGQNAISQANIFHEAVGISQIALTKLDGTAKGGIVAAISHSLQVPITYIGVGEKTDDLQVFDSKRFIQALFEPGN